MEKYRHQNFIHWIDQFLQEIFRAKEIPIFRNLKSENFYFWLKSKDIAVLVLKVYLIFHFQKIPI